MVTSVGTVLSAALPSSPEPASRKTEQSIAEARRLMIQNKISGGEAMRILSALSQAEQNISAGKTADAQRLARAALKLAQQKSESLPSIPAQNETGTNALPSGEESSSNETPASQTQGIDPDQPFQRNTTSYKDGSDDSGVSFQSAQPITPGQAPFAVQQHELSHVRRETSDAILNGQRVMASVTIHSQIDPASGERQIGGGRTRVIIFPDIQPRLLPGHNLDVQA